jgi:hypothetical protein
MKVHRQDAVDARRLEHVGDQPRGDRLTGARLPVLPGVRVPGHDRGDALRRRELRRLDHDQQLHQVAVDRLGAGLDEEDVGAADRLLEATVRLAVGERAEVDGAELEAEPLGDLLREVRVRAAGEEHEPFRRTAFEPMLGTGLRDRHGRNRLEAREGCELSRRRRLRLLHVLRTPPCSLVALWRRRARRAGRLW